MQNLKEQSQKKTQRNGLMRLRENRSLTLHNSKLTEDLSVRPDNLSVIEKRGTRPELISRAEDLLNRIQTIRNGK